MKLLLTLIIAAVVAAGQDITFIPQPSSVPGLTEYEAVIGNNTQAPIRMTAAEIKVKAFHSGIALATYTNVLKAIEDANGRSPFRYAGIVLEVTGWAGAVLITSDTIKINERWKVLFPTVAGGLTFARTLINRERRDVALPQNLLPPIFDVPPGGATYTVFGGEK